MNCLAVRRHLLADPGSQDSGLHEHVQQCEDCARFIRDLTSFETGLKQASKVEVPEGLASRILLRQRLGTQHQRRRRGLAMAAGLVLGVAAVLTGILTGGIGGIGTPNLEQVVLQHVNDELHHLDDRYDLSIKQVNSMLHDHGSQLTALPGRKINYAGACQIRRTKGAHLVVDAASGPITVLFMPGEFVERRSQLQDRRFRGVIIPTRQGSMAIVGEDPQQIEQLERELSSQIVDLS